MLVYGDHARTVETRRLLLDIEARLDRADQTTNEVHGRELYARAYFDAAELAQGIADDEFLAMGRDHLSTTQAASLALAGGLARKAFVDRGGASPDIEPTPRAEIAKLVRASLPTTIVCRLAEGHAFYAVYPQAYIASALRHRWPAPPLVIGLRSIGTGLAAAVASVTGAKTTLTVRPIGDPFRRRLAVGDELKDRLRAHTGPFAIVDEGPGLSGSSFGAVGDLLAELGVGVRRMVFLPSHGGSPGPRASSAHRLRWDQATRVVTTLDDLIGQDPLEGWFSDLIGPVECVEDLSAGAWCARWRGADRPPVWARRERRKFRLETPTGRYLARFAGLGWLGEEKFVHAKALFQAGFTAEPLALRRGMLLERWVEGGPVDWRSSDRQPFLRQLARYIGFRAAMFPASQSDGAAPADLVHMAVVNAGELAGERLAASVAGRLAGFPALLRRPRAIHVDGRLHPWEWVRTGAGRFRKTDALDHARDHDLVGCQDVMWDVAGAAVEFGLSPAERNRLVDEVSATIGRAAEGGAVEMFMLIYAAFQAGSVVMAASGDEDAAQLAVSKRRGEFYMEVMRGRSL